MSGGAPVRPGQSPLAGGGLGRPEIGRKLAKAPPSRRQKRVASCRWSASGWGVGGTLAVAAAGMVKIVTYNVNGLRPRVAQHGSLRRLLDALDADIICFQVRSIAHPLPPHRTPQHWPMPRNLIMYINPSCLMGYYFSDSLTVGHHK